MNEAEYHDSYGLAENAYIQTAQGDPELTGFHEHSEHALRAIGRALHGAGWLTPDEAAAARTPRYCCKQMREMSTLRCDRHALPGDCPDVLMVHSDRHGPGLPVRDGGGSFVAIHFCPWCGADASQALTVGDRDV